MTKSFDQALRDAARCVYYPQELKRFDLYARITSAAHATGLPETDIRLWKPGLITTWSSAGVMREKALFETYMEPDKDLDIGYITENARGNVTVRSFHINAWAFSDQMYETFHEELKQRGLEPQYTRAGIDRDLFGSRIMQAPSEKWDEFNNRTPRYG
ncbi:TPA: hypothetical protein HA278_05065 [Candidatus Woesearchaeota archaeon]|nr:hypothetical protein [Candidatus Woesearchaeota archaeon]|tara:strand:+ start:734 stop:1207 length:474 start_codon:yes stop_codon:yes gene_type:complete